MATFFQKKPAVGLSLKRDKTGPLSIVNIVLLSIHYKNFMPRLKGQWHSEEENGRYVPRHCSLEFDVMYHGARGAEHGGLLVVDGG